MVNPKLLALLPDLATFILIVNEGSFTAAAKRLGVTPSALSKLITRLEKALEVKLFERTTRQLVITQVGSRIYDQSLAMVTAAQQAIEISAQDHAEPQGSLTVAAPEAFLNSVLQPFVLPFLAQYPNIELKLRAADGAIDLFHQGIDVAFMLTDKPDENLVLKEIRPTNLVLCASPSYVAARSMPQHPQQLSEHDCLYLAENDKDNLWSFFREDAFCTVAVKGRYSVNQSQLRLNGVKAGLGIGIFHDFVIQQALNDGDVIEVLPDWTLKSNYHGVIAMQYPRMTYMPARLRAFIDFIEEQVIPKLEQHNL
ncbi:LysR family transcriptional regulator [Vibrio sp. SM6]|uniref:LysR family transcriptional regulator n=1 Tax=Vibrio agarilyticus TaxID=2726741 RepID=A0A7X8YFL7_9VIBR|nr:LysR family transcriptional regulator [Vibrio agarilyticus]NLS11799.1 LysR family transcriptional regulator [Vibrio agarilyticus]